MQIYKENPVVSVGMKRKLCTLTYYTSFNDVTAVYSQLGKGLYKLLYIININATVGTIYKYKFRLGILYTDCTRRHASGDWPSTRRINARADEIPITTTRKRVSHTHARGIILYMCAHENTTSEFHTLNELLTYTHTLSLHTLFSLYLSLSLSLSYASVVTIQRNYFDTPARSTLVWVQRQDFRPLCSSGRYVIIILRYFTYKKHVLTPRDYRRQPNTKSA